MVFQSLLFIAIFLPLALLGWYGLLYFQKVQLAKCYIVGMSLWFYGYLHPLFLVVLLASILGNYLFSGWLVSASKPKVALYMVLVINLAPLLFFKYYPNILIPLGISFFTFQQIGYLVDLYQKEAKRIAFLDYLFFVTFFPYLLSGPIVAHQEVMPVLAKLAVKDSIKERLAKDLLEGIYLFVLGLGKKVLLADLFAQIVEDGYLRVYHLDTLSALLVVISYSLQVFFDFSGYSDMAIGLGRMFGFELPDNFFSPYQATGMQDFWGRWHITLTRFFRKYLYIPMGGNRKGKLRTVLHVLIVFVVSGLWHGTTITYVLWGFMHGLFVVIEKYTKPLPKALGRLTTFSSVTLLWVLFRSSSLQQAVTMYRSLLKGVSWDAFVITIKNIDIPELYAMEQVIGTLWPEVDSYYYLMVVVILLLVSWCFLGQVPARIYVQTKAKNFATAVVLTLVLCWSLVSLSQVHEFLYFRY